MGSQTEAVQIRNLQSLIPLINKVQDVFNTVRASGDGMQAVSLPQIVVVGSQSSGKSSVLESLVGKSFLPRGSDVVTRCPIILQLFTIPPDDTEFRASCPHNYAEWCEFLHVPGVFIQDFDEVTAAIRKETNKIAGINRGISAQPMTLKVYSKNVPTLTLVDLPGIVKVPVGDQPQDIEIQVRTLIRTYTNDPNSVILAVTPANADMATSDGIQMAKEADPEGSRTLVVLTKLDLIDPGKNAIDILSGKVLPVKLGIIGVVNRSQRDIDEDKTVEEGLLNEESFLKRDYPALASKHGIPHLAKRLHQILLEHIRDRLPHLETKVRTSLQDWQETLDSLGTKVENKQSVLHHAITQFCDEYRGAIDGRSRNMKHDKLAGAARIRIVFDEIFSQEIHGLESIKDLSNETILNAIRNTSGLEVLFLRIEEAFRELVKEQIRRLLAPSLLCATLVNNVMKEMIEDSLNHPEIKIKLGRFPVLSSSIKSVVCELIDERRQETEVMLRAYIDVQSSFVVTNNLDFNTQLASIKELPPMEASGTNNLVQGPPPVGSSTGNGTPPSQSEIQTKQCDVVRSFMQRYLHIIKDEVYNYVVRAVTHFTIYHIEKHLQVHLLDYLMSPDRIEALIQESSTISMKRNEAENMVQALEEAKSFIYEIREAK